jgi:hypothetical protein
MLINHVSIAFRNKQTHTVSNVIVCPSVVTGPLLEISVPVNDQYHAYNIRCTGYYLCLSYLNLHHALSPNVYGKAKFLETV